MTNINQSKLKKANKVFNDVFNKYDIMNDIMSLGTHRFWKKRLIDWMKAPIEDVSWLVRQRKDFVKMIREFDIRRDKSFLETFPEMETFYRACEGLL